MTKTKQKIPFKKEHFNEMATRIDNEIVYHQNQRELDHEHLHHAEVIRRLLQVRIKLYLDAAKDTGYEDHQRAWKAERTITERQNQIDRLHALIEEYKKGEVEYQKEIADKEKHLQRLASESIDQKKRIDELERFVAVYSDMKRK